MKELLNPESNAEMKIFLKSHNETQTMLREHAEMRKRIATNEQSHQYAQARAALDQPRGASLPHRSEQPQQQQQRQHRGVPQHMAAGGAHTPQAMSAPPQSMLVEHSSAGCISTPLPESHSYYSDSGVHRSQTSGYGGRQQTLHVRPDTYGRSDAQESEINYQPYATSLFTGNPGMLAEFIDAGKDQQLHAKKWKAMSGYVPAGLASQIAQDPRYGKSQDLKEDM